MQNYTWIQSEEPQVLPANEYSDSKYLQKLSMALRENLKPHQIPHCKYMVDDIGCLIILSGGQAYLGKISNEIHNNIFKHLK
jgi:hypothetical protein